MLALNLVCNQEQSRISYPSASTSQVLGQQVCAIAPGLCGAGVAKQALYQLSYILSPYF